MFFDAPPDTIPDDLEAEEYYELGKWYHEAEDLDRARVALQRAIDSSTKVSSEAAYFMTQNVPRHPIPKPVFERFSQLRWTIPNPAKRCEEYRAILAEYPDFDWAYTMLGMALLQQVKVPEALECQQKALSLNPDREQTLLSLVEIYIMVMDYDSARLYLSKLRKVLSEHGRLQADDQDNLSTAAHFRQISRSLQILMAMD